MRRREISVIILLIALGLSGCDKEVDTKLQIDIEDMTPIMQNTDQEVFTESKVIAECYRNIYVKAKEEKTSGDLETVKKIIQCLGNSGYVAVDVNNKIDMVNSDQLEEFCRKADKKQDSEMVIIAVMNNGGFIRYDLQILAEKEYVTRSYLNWNESTPEVEYLEKYPAYSWHYSEMGYLFFEQYRPSGFDGPSGHTAIRVKPLDEKCRDLNRKYLEPIGYNLNNLFTSDWSEEDYQNLNFYDLYEIMCQMEDKEFIYYKFINTEGTYEIPKVEFENVFRTYFQVDSWDIQKNTIYQEASETYQYRPRGMYDFASTPNIPYPEVVAYEENDNGTIKLTVNAVWPEENLEQAFSHELVVRPLSDGGFQYVSNHINPSEKNVEPTWYTERLTDEEWEKYCGGMQ